MQFLVLLYADEAGFAALPPEDMQKAIAAFAEYNRSLAAAGVLRHGEPLKASRTAKTLRAPRGKVVTTDGPFAESKEQLGGYYVLETADEAEALAWAAKCPLIYSGSIEVRELLSRM